MNSLALSKGCPFLLSLDFETLNISAATPTLVADTTLSQQKYFTDRSTKAVFLRELDPIGRGFLRAVGQNTSTQKFTQALASFLLLPLSCCLPKINYCYVLAGAYR